MSETDEAVGRVTAWACDLIWGATLDGKDCKDVQVILAALARVTEELSAARRDAGAFRVAVSLALGPCAPEHEGTPVVDAIQRMREERDALRGELFDVREELGEVALVCEEAEKQALTRAERILVLTTDLATLRERLAGEVGALRSASGYSFDSHTDGFNVGIDRAVAVIRGEG